MATLRKVTVSDSSYRRLTPTSRCGAEPEGPLLIQDARAEPEEATPGPTVSDEDHTPSSNTEESSSASSKAWQERYLALTTASTCALIDGKARLGKLPIMGCPVLVDDDDANYVLVFPKEMSENGDVDPDEIIHEPLEACKRIFERRSNPDSHCTMSINGELREEFKLLDHGPVRAALYQSIVRETIVRILSEAGLKLTAFQSIDKDEVFVKIALPLDGETVRRLATRYKYQVPYTLQAYQNAKDSVSVVSTAAFNEDNIPRNKKGMDIFAYGAYGGQENDADLSDLRPIDVDRLLIMYLDEWMDLSALESQNVIAKHFPAASYDQVMNLHAVWSDWRLMTNFPSHDAEEEVREYFGEKITFFFHWFSFYTAFLVPLAAAGFICALRRVPALHISQDVGHYMQMLFALTSICWSQIFNISFQRRSSRYKQRWGMKDYEERAMDRPEYNPALEGTAFQYILTLSTDIFAVVFCVAFAGSILAFEYVATTRARLGDYTLDGCRKYVTVASVNIVSYIWARVAPALVNLQNHRTTARWEAALTWILVLVKMFVAVFPFFNISFLKLYFQAVCPDEGKGFANAVWKVYGETDTWPPGIVPPISGPNSTLAYEDEGFNFLYSYRIRVGAQECVQGCFPVNCEDSASSCETNCSNELQQNLFMVFVTHMTVSTLFTVIPIFLLQWKMQDEIEKVGRSSKHRPEWVKKAPRFVRVFITLLGQARARCLGKDPYHVGAVAPYSFIQFQAKCYEVAKFEYYSWGGSQVENFLELSIGFTLLTCFGIHLPSMSVIALCSHVIEYRLLAYRMAHVTCRPNPEGAEGIGVWQNVFDAVSELAAIINVAIAVFMMDPFRRVPWRERLTYFVVAEHALFFIRKAIRGAISDTPGDVRRIDDFNFQMITLLQKKSRLQVPEEEKYDARSVDISMGPSAIDVRLNCL